MKNYFKKQEKEVLSMIIETKELKFSIPGADDITNWVTQNKELRTLLNPLWIGIAEDTIAQIDKIFTLSANFELVKESVTARIRESGAEQVVRINNTTRDAIREALTEGIENQEGIPDLRNRVMSVFEDASRRRATVIARTETHNTVGTATFGTYQSAKVEKKQWLTAIDGRERPSHADVNGEIKGINEQFSNGLMYPGDPNGAPEEVIQCRCVLLPIIPDF